MKDRRLRIVALPGDGIGPEVLNSARCLLDVMDCFDVEEHLIGGASIDAYGEPLTDEVIDACKRPDTAAVLLGAVGGPRWDTTDSSRPRPEQGLLRIRKELGNQKGLYANLRPVCPFPALLDASPLKRAIVEGTDLLVVRELTGGIYYGERENRNGKAKDTCEYDEEEIERIADIAFLQARRRAETSHVARVPKVTSVDKANVMDTSRLWRATVEKVRREGYNGGSSYLDVELEHLLVDNAAAQLLVRPRDFDVILTENTFGDILSDEAAMLAGSLGMLPSASVDHVPPGLFEPVHGSAPDIAGKGTANPLGMLLTVAMMLRDIAVASDDQRRRPEFDPVASMVEQAVEKVLDDGLRTPDLIRDLMRQSESPGPATENIVQVNTAEMTDAVVSAFRSIHDAVGRTHEAIPAGALGGVA